jgi:hypothetical protein
VCGAATATAAAAAAAAAVVTAARSIATAAASATRSRRCYGLDRCDSGLFAHGTGQLAHALRKLLRVYLRL